MDLEKYCQDIYPLLEDYFIGADISALALIKPKINGLVVRRFLREGMIERIEVKENLFVYKKTAATISDIILLEKIEALNAEQRRLRANIRRRRLDKL